MRIIWKKCSGQEKYNGSLIKWDRTLYKCAKAWHCTKNERFLQYMWPHPQLLVDLITFTEDSLTGNFPWWEGWSLSRKPEVRIRAITTLIEYFLHVISQIWFDEIYLLIDNIYTSDKHFHFYFPWWQNYGTVLKYFSMQSLATSLYPRKFRWVIYTLYKSELWKPLRLRYDCTKFHVPEEEMLEEVGIKSCPLYKETASKRSVLNKFVLF